MVTVEGVDYIKKQLAKGLTREQIEKALSANGWQPDDIQEAFRLAQFGTPISTATTPSGGSELPGPIALLHEAWDMYKPLMWKFLKANIFSFILTIPISFLAILLLIVMLFLAKLSIWSLIVTIPLLLFIVVLDNVVAEWGEVADIELLKDNGERIGAIEAMKRSRHLIFSFFVVQFLIGLLIISGVFSFGVPGLLFMIWFSFAPFIVMVEGERGMRALLKSREYIRGRFAAVFGRMLFVGGVAILFQIAIGILQAIAKSNTTGSYSSGISSVVVGIVSLILELILICFIPVLVTYVFVLYKHVRVVKGSFVFNPTTKQKGVYFLSLLGLLIFFLPVVSLTMLLPVHSHPTAHQSTIITPSVSPSISPKISPVPVSPTPTTQISISPTPTAGSLPIYNPAQPATPASGLGSPM